MIRTIAALFLVLFSLAAPAHGKSWLDQSHDIFMPPQVREQLRLYRDFPVFWWNFLVFDFETENIAWSDVSDICDAIVTAHRDLIAKSPCPAQWTAETPFLREWIADQALRRDPGSAEVLLKKSQATLAQAGLPLPRSILQILRVDPFGALGDLMGKAKSVPLALEERQGFLFDRAHRRVVIPFQFSFPPQQATSMKILNAMAGEMKPPGLAAPAFWVGPHASTLENETRVQNDLEAVSLAGFAIFGLLGLFLLFTGRIRVLTLVPILLAAIAITAALTVFIFGSIHGIVLSFGPGIVGLAMDYGIHSAFMGPRSRRTWIANLLGILTTGIVLVLMAFSQIPLMQQLMVFSLIGLLVSFGLFYFFLQKYPGAFGVAPYDWAPWRSKTWGTLTALSIAGLLCLPFLNLNLDLRQMNFESARTAELQKDLFHSSGMGRSVFVEREAADALETGIAEKTWADSQKIAYQGAAVDLPPVADQNRNLAKWTEILCPSKLKWSADAKAFFEPAPALWPCASATARTLEKPPVYVQDFQAGGRWLSLFLPKNDAQVLAVQTKFPAALVASEVFASVPKILLAELLWMAPLSLFGAWFILFLYYRNRRTSLLAVIPFLTGLGTFALMTALTKQPITFVSLVGLIMIFGMSLDYGVFVVNFLDQKDRTSVGVWSALALSAAATLAGFVPLLFAHHPVLYQLGHALTWGTVGTCLGALFGLPWLASRTPGARSKKVLRVVGLALLLAVNFAVATYHAGVLVAPALRAGDTGHATWLDKSEHHLNHLILEGDPYPRALEAGHLTANLLRAQEDSLVGKMEDWIPSKILRQMLVLTGILYFQGADRYLEPWMTEEMAGISVSASKDYDSYIDGLTRQLAYHGLHEVGQMMVDQGTDLVGCTVVALPFGKSWILGRNFDFEGGRIFDDEKIVKWVFPKDGAAYVSVIWAGMVGAVTGVNEHGLYISLNAAGSEDRRRVGLTSTMLLAKVLQDAKSVDDALAIFEKTPMFITDLFVMLDRDSGRLFRIEKSPQRMVAIELKAPSVVTNHLVDPIWNGDKTNLFRKTELTSHVRYDRGLDLIQKLAKTPGLTASRAEDGVLAILRDKGVGPDGRALHLGNRQAIDAMIAAHSAVYNAEDQILYVSGGPAVSGPYYGYDLKESFRRKQPVEARVLSRDPLVSDKLFDEIRDGELYSLRARQKAHRRHCDEAEENLAKVPASQRETSEYQYALGETRHCENKNDEAKLAWKKALALQPAYAKARRELDERLAK